MISSAILEAQQNFLSKYNERAQSENENDLRTSQLFSTFKRPSVQSLKQGKSRLLYEDMIQRAEHKLSKIKQMSTVASQSLEERAEVLAQEFFHKPGSMLMADEIAQIWQESGCSIVKGTPDCNFATVNQFRTMDGTCNNLANATLGSSTAPFSRLLPALYEDGISSLRGALQAQSEILTIGPFAAPNPSARLISETVVQNVSQEELPFTHILMQFGQFLDHDLDLSPELEVECVSCTFSEVCSPIRVADRDRTFGVGTPNNADCLRFRRSLPACETDPPLSFSPREQINDITSFIDGSMIYGSTDEVGNVIRAFTGGQLRTGRRFPGSQDSLPVDTDKIVACPNRMDCFLCGDVRCNEQISLTIMHTIWLREHNRCARELSRINSHWGDERLYQECRKIVGALIQKIVYLDYLPKVLGPLNFERFIGPYPGYIPEVDPSVPNSFATAAYRYGHSLVRPQFDRLDANYRPLSIGPLNLMDAFFNPTQFHTSLGTDPILRGLVTTHSLRMDEFMNMVLTKRLFQTRLTPGMDLASLNIQRGRDHGLPPYPVWQNFCFRIFGKITDFENHLTLVRFLQVYGSLDTLDLWIGGLAEDRLPDSLLGATFACIFGLTFQKVRNGDRFYFERPGVFQPDQLNEIMQGSLSRIICDNSDNIEHIQPDAFLSNTSRVRCNQLPSVDLSRWKENVCFYKVQIRPRQFEFPISTFSRTTQPEFVFSGDRIASSSVNQFRCIQFQCPTTRSLTDIVVFSDVSFQNILQITASSTLPSSQLVTPSSYRANWSVRLSSNPGSGLFVNEEDCNRSSQVALIFSFARSLEVQAIQDDEKKNPISRVMVPADVLSIINEGVTHSHRVISSEAAQATSTSLLKTLLEQLN